MYPKTEYVRSQKLLKLVASLRCQHCGNSDNVQAAHANWSEFGKGKGIKASDIYTAALCLSCHYEIDQGSNLTKEQRKEMWINAHKKTIETLIMNREWISGIPLPDVGKFE
jgi:CRISPR/Cas system-associated protein Cas10 (large subunit of type III CRISPR-Cas system)